MITKDTTLRNAYDDPVGHQVLTMLLEHTRRSPELLDKPMVSYVNFGSIEFLIGKLAHGKADELVNTTCRLSAETPPPSAETVRREIVAILPQLGGAA